MFLGGGVTWGLGNFQKIPAQQKLWKENHARGAIGKTINKVLLLSFYVTKIIAHVIANKKSCITWKRTRAQKTPNPQTLRKKSVSPCVVNIVYQCAIYFFLGDIKTNEILTDMIAQ